MEETLKFKLARKTIPVILENEDGVETTYLLKELNGKGRDDYMALMMANVQIGPDGKASNFTAPTGLATKLVSLCLHDEEGKRIGQKRVEVFPSRVINELFKVAQKISALNLTDKKEEDAGND